MKAVLVTHWNSRGGRFAPVGYTFSQLFGEEGGGYFWIIK